MLGKGVGKHAAAQNPYTEDVCGYGKNRMPRRGKAYRDFAPDLERIQRERTAKLKSSRPTRTAAASIGKFRREDIRIRSV